MGADTCYDCMAHSMISLCLQCLALAVEVITSLLLTIQLMKFFLQTAFGDSTCFYGSRQPIPLQGCCQGNGGGPAMWVLASIILVHQLWANGHVTMFIRAISGLKVSFAGFLYVDDGDLATAACTPTESEASMVDRAQKGTSCWQGGLRASGGDAKFEKTFWTLICFIWLNGNWHYKTKDETIGKLFMLGPNNEQLKITKLDPSKLVKAVGITQLVDGCMAGQLEEMLSKIEDFGTAFHDGWVPRRYVWLGLSLPQCPYFHTYAPTPPSKYDWANKQPSHSDWNLWRAALKILTSQNLSLPFFDRLSCWTKSPPPPHSQQMALLSHYPVPLQITPWWLILLCSMNKQLQCSLPPQGILHYTTPSQFLHRYHTSQQVGLRHPNGLGHNCPL